MQVNWVQFEPVDEWECKVDSFLSEYFVFWVVKIGDLLLQVE